MRQAATLPGVLVLLALQGCSTMRSSGKSDHPGIQDRNPAALTRTYPASATRVAWAMSQVMTDDSILDDVKLMIDPQSNESPLPKAEREALGLPSMSISARDVNYNIQAKSKDGRRVGAIVQIKGESECEVSLLYGSMGDADLSRVLLDGVEAAIKGPVKNPGLWKAADVARSDSRKTAGR